MSDRAPYRSRLITGLLILIFVVIAGRDLSRPFHGLHDWDRAYASWSARAHVHYGLGYTRGLGTFAVGDPPPAQPARFLDHPQLPMLLNAYAMLVFGVNQWSFRLTALLVTAACIPLLLGLLRRLYGSAAAILATLTWVLVPVTGYFHSGWAFWMLPPTLSACWSYLALIGRLGPLESSRLSARAHRIILALSLFLVLQVDWPGAFLAAAIGLDYAWRCLRAKSIADRSLLAILVVAPASSLVLDFVILAGAGGWDFDRLLGLYRVRSAITGGAGRTVTGWVLQQAEYARANFTLPVLVAALTYLLLRLVAAWWRRVAHDDSGEPLPDATASASEIRERSSSSSGSAILARFSALARPFPHAWLLLAPGVMNLIVFRETFWVHEFNQSVFTIPLAVMSALAVLSLRDLVRARSELLGDVLLAAWVAAVAAFSLHGLETYRAVEQRSPVEIAVMSELSRRIPPDESLLTYRNYNARPTMYHPDFYRPEIAWHLDRKIVIARSAEDVERLASIGGFPFYLVETPPAPRELVDAMKARYPWQFYQESPLVGDPKHRGTAGDFYVFDLRGAGR